MSVGSGILSSESQIELEYPGRLVPYPGWVGHIPFALWIIGAQKPNLIVELGVHTGNSYCAFLQAVKSLRLHTKCIGIDHWKGDEHAGFYGNDVYEELKAYHDPLYGTFSTLLQSSFADAVLQFADGTIDLLHIDGFHTFDAVSRDFARWLPKMSPRGIVLFHDTMVRENGMEVWRFWEETASRYPAFEFIHSHGLGVLYVGSDPLTSPLDEFFGLNDRSKINKIQTYFARLGTSVVDRYNLAQERKAMIQIEARSAHELGAEKQRAATELALAQQRAAADIAGIESRLVLKTQLLSQLTLANSRLQEEIRVMPMKYTIRAKLMRRIPSVFKRMIPSSVKSLVKRKALRMN